MTKATFSATYYHFGFGPGAANYGQIGYLPFGTASNQARFRHGELSISSAKSNPNSPNSWGSAISSIMTAVAQTSGLQAALMYLNGVGSTASGTEKIWIPDKAAVGYRIDIIATSSDSANSGSAHFIHTGTIRRPNAGSITIDNNNTETVNDSFGTSTQVIANTSDNSLDIEVTGQTGFILRWVARIDLVQVIIGG